MAIEAPSHHASVDEAVDGALLALEVQGHGVEPAPLGNLLGGRPTLLVFLRHYGCLFYRQLAADVLAAAREIDGFPDPVFVYQGSTEEGSMFFGDDPDIRAVADPNGGLYVAFGVAHGGAREMFGAASWRCGLRAVSEGHFINRKVGDPWTLPTLVLVHDGRICWRHDGRHAGDHPDLTDVPCGDPSP